MACGNPKCETLLRATRECHHPQCTVNGKHIRLCRICDKNLHKSEDYQGHLVLDLNCTREDIIKLNLDTEVKFTCDNAPDEEEEKMAEPEPDYSDSNEESQVHEEVIAPMFTKHNSSSARMSSISKRLKRKDAVKRRSSIDIQNRVRSRSLTSIDLETQFNSVPVQLEHVLFPSERIQNINIPLCRDKEIQFVIEFPDNYINVPVVKGKTIQDLLTSRLNVDVNSVCIYMESSNTPLPVNSSANLLEGNRLHLKDKENRQLLFIKKPPPYITSKHRKSMTLSMDDTIYPKATSRNMFISNKQKDRDKLEQMFDILKNSVSLLPAGNSEDAGDVLLSLENSWRDIVKDASDLPKQIQSQQEVIWELLSTEITYIESLQVITNLFMSCLQTVQNKLPYVMKEIEIEKLFSNIVEVFAANSVFWKDYLSEIVEVSRRTHDPIDPSLLKEGFTKFPELFKPYQRFCAEQIFCQNYIKTQYKSNEYFKNFVIWAEGNTNQCKRLRLIDIIITPMQRLTRYSLLLRRIKDQSIEEKQKEDLEFMIQTVDTFVSGVNLIVGQKRERDKLNAIASRIDCYEGVEAPNEECVKILNSYSQQFTLASPMPFCHPEQSRILLYHCSLKYKARQDVECYLFTDLLLICKLKKLNERLKVLKPPIRIDQISIEELKDKGSILMIQINEYNVPTLAFTLHADQSTIKKFISNINKAKQFYKEAYQYFLQWQQLQNTGDPSFTDVIPKLQYPSPFQEGKHDKLTDPCPSPNRPHVFLLSKTKPQISPSEHMISPRIVCDSPSPETQTYNSLLLPNTEMKISHSMPSCASSEWLSQSSREETKAKSERNRKTEKRYNTADSIQELKRSEHADNAIYKRFSWNSGSTHKENRQSLYKHVSSDSIRSSSGVSSTCSSHLSPDHENNENEEETLVNVMRQPSLTESNVTENCLYLNTENKTLSKSMPDIAALIQDVTPSEMRDGISSVDISRLNQINFERLNKVQILNIKKYLLLNSANESEV